MEAYCVKCHSKREMSNAQAITMKNDPQPPGHSGRMPSLFHKDVPDRQSCRSPAVPGDRRLRLLEGEPLR